MGFLIYMIDVWEIYIYKNDFDECFMTFEKCSCIRKAYELCYEIIYEWGDFLCFIVKWDLRWFEVEMFSNHWINIPTGNCLYVMWMCFRSVHRLGSQGIVGTKSGYWWYLNFKSWACDIDDTCISLWDPVVPSYRL